MAKQFRSASAFKTSMEARLKALAEERKEPLHSLRLKTVIERLLARLFALPDPVWLLKGGFALELRFRPRARTTKDVDLSIGQGAFPNEADRQPERLRERLQEAADADLGDYLQFRIGEAQMELAGAPQGGARFLCEAILAGKSYGKFHIDIGCGDAMTGPAESLIGEGLLAFAGISPAQVRAISSEQQFAEKLHAYTFLWSGRQNTRTKDIVDLVLLIETGVLDTGRVREAIRATFAARNTHRVPAVLTPPPDLWKADFTAMALEARLSTSDYLKGFAVLERFWHSLSTTPASTAHDTGGSASSTLPHRR